MNASEGLHRWASFAGVGAVGLAVQLAALALLTGWTGLPPPAATAMAVELTVLHNFAWHECWTWRDRARAIPGRWFLRLARFHAASGLISLAGNVALTVGLVEWLHTPIVIANAGAVVLLGLVNFVVADRYVFEPCVGREWSFVGRGFSRADQRPRPRRCWVVVDRRPGLRPHSGDVIPSKAHVD